MKNKKLMQKMGEILRNLRGEMSLREVARESNVSRAFLSRMERGLAAPSAETLLKLSEYYQLPLEAFFPGKRKS
jgi:transcriptional regulator with XRE-family HTH domain